MSSFRFRSCLFFCIVSVLFVPFAAVAEEPVADFGEMVVTATRYPELLTTVPAHVTVISREAIENSTAQSVPELLRAAAGVQVNDISGNRRNVTVDLRGFGETANLNVVALLDGRRINQADLSGIDWTQIPLERIDRIEIIRGGRESVLFGDNAAGGVINIITKEGAEFAAGGTISGGSYGTLRAGADVSGTAGALSYAMSGTYFSTDGYRHHSDVESEDLGLNLNYYVGEHVRVGLSGGYHDEEANLPGALLESDFAAGASRKDTMYPEDFAETEDYYVKAQGEVTFWGDSVVKADLGYRQRDFLSFSSFAGGNFRGDTEIGTITFNPQVVVNRPLGGLNNTLTAGYDYLDAEEDIENESIFFGDVSTGSFDLEKENHGFYLHDTVTVLPDLRFSAGYRFDRAEYTFDPSTPSSATLDEDLYTAGVNYTFRGASYLYASYSRSFRYPVLDELFSFFTNTIVTDLTAQRSDDFELGARYYFRGEDYLQASLFMVETDNEIFFNPNTFANENLDGTTERTGIEASFAANVHERVRLNGSYTWLDAEIAGGQFDGNEVPNVAEHKFSLGCDVDVMSGLTLGIKGIFVGERRFVSDFSNVFGYQDDYLIVNARAQYSWNRFTAFLNLNNITDEEYAEYGVIGGFPQEQAIYPSPRFNVLAGLSVSM